MAPSLEDPVSIPTVGNVPVPKADPVPEKRSVDDSNNSNKFGYEPGRTPVERHDSYAYEDLLPSFPDLHLDPIEHIPYEDRGLRGDPKFRNLLRDATDIFDYTPKIGTEIHGINLAKLTDAQKDDLARLIAVRGVVFFRQQDDFDIEAQRELGRYFGKLHKVSWRVFSGLSGSRYLTSSSMLLPLSHGRRDWKMFMLCILVIIRRTSEHCSRLVSCGIQMYVLWQLPDFVSWAQLY